MENIKNFFKDLVDNAKGVVNGGKDLYENHRAKFIQVMLKGGVGFLFFISLMIPFYYGVVIGLRINVGLFDLRGWFIYFILFLGFVVIYLLYGLNNKLKQANKVFRIHTIFAIIMVFWTAILYLADTSGISVRGLSFGWFLDLIFAVIMALLTWKESLLLKPIIKIFVKENQVEPKETQVEEIPEVEIVDESVKEEEPEKAENKE
ncbi:hypothetical protein ACAG96_00080 [Candidatus Izemoplasma sp. B36]|uniref:hypothetical protein n=1 Tax=Candidatus Izemoplasma sp. B36 TaxID=3242468 RepID=UPI003556F152